MLASIALFATISLAKDEIKPIDPPEDGFYAKVLNCDGIPIKASKEVSDAAFVEAAKRLRSLWKKQPNVLFNLVKAGGELHIIGKDQVTSDLPENRDMKGKPFDGKLTVDERTRGLGGLITSCGEENLLKLDNDRYKGRDICRHEFAHNIFGIGVTEKVRQLFRDQMKKSMDQGLWVGAYAATNEHEFFAELTMWYYGTRGDLNMKGAKPADGPDGLKAYDPDAYKLFDDFYQGRIKVDKKRTRRTKE